ncbi:hypothetical protein FHS76_002208 [Ochrobactrum daejeonense]|uniref:Uncharacterized protein n=1 Tax=Brucella daejeonensis TaxID=659015 RepID=A0A7W9EMR6_9HYPH|nr:hypothetical protein [Brucella daejeonensis]
MGSFRLRELSLWAFTKHIGILREVIGFVMEALERKHRKRQLFQAIL